MIQARARVRIRPDDPRIYEMLNVSVGSLLGTVITSHEPAPFAHDKRTRWCVRFDNNHYGLFYAHELEEVASALKTPPIPVLSQQSPLGGP